MALPRSACQVRCFLDPLVKCGTFPVSLSRTALLFSPLMRYATHLVVIVTCCDRHVTCLSCCRNETHKNDVLLLCQQRARDCRARAPQGVDAENAALLWNYLQLLIKQNGVSATE